MTSSLLLCWFLLFLPMDFFNCICSISSSNLANIPVISWSIVSSETGPSSSSTRAGKFSLTQMSLSARDVILCSPTFPLMSTFDLWTPVLWTFFNFLLFGWRTLVFISPGLGACLPLAMMLYRQPLCNRNIEINLNKDLHEWLTENFYKHIKLTTNK